ncbi:hypothetical protein [Caballeronia sp. LZ032]|uniref:hypothetical protein n=1 Tax=Caballeronia sp. LZ032 TaxID=3038565 RepID=UPI00285CA234|nr:hypothetical protein [Caballeronia sp. LZ032]MDR5883637.1 hypothetical protein [Caballeronia sp. LZ032]
MHVFFDFEQAMKAPRGDAFMISFGGVLFAFKWNLVEGSDKLVIFLPGTTDRGRPVPSFQRSSYFEDLNANCVACFDPTLLLSPTLSLAWFQGEGERFYASMLAQLVKQMLTALKIDGQNVLIYASSGGGIPGFNVAAAVAESTLYVCNVQTDASKYWSTAYSAMATVCYPGEKPADLPAKYDKRLSVHHFDAPFNLVFSQNLEDAFHYERHFLPYVQYAEPRKLIRSSKFVTYADKASGHNPLPRATELGVIRRLLEGRDVLELFPQGAYFQ